MRNLTIEELNVLSNILFAVKNCMEWDETLEEYTDNSNFILSMTEEEMNYFNSLYKKI